MVTKILYSVFARYYLPCQSPAIFKYVAHALQKIFGLATFNYGGIKLAAGPVGYLDNYIINGRNINPYVTSALKQYLHEGGIFLDIGANHGVFSLLAAKNPNVQVFAFEPSHRELARLWKNLQLNKKNNISILSYGIGQQEKLQDFVLSDIDNPGKNSLPEILAKGISTSCYFAPLHKLLSTDILNQTRVCKLDVEGQELLILNSLRPYMHLLNQCVFVIEISPKFLSKLGQRAEDIYNFFDQMGFKYQSGNPDNLIQWEEFFYHPSHTDPLIYSEIL